MKNIHITLTEFRNESRVLKEISSLEASNCFHNFTVVALGSVELPSKEVISSKVTVQRIKLLSRGLPKSSPFQVIKFLEFMLKSFFLVKKEKAAVVNLHTLALLPLGYLLKKFLKIKLVYDTHELETEKNGLHGIRQKVSKWIESKFIYSCDLVIVVGDLIADWYESTYKITRPLVVKNAPKFREKYKKDLFREALDIRPEQKILLYQGALSRGRGVELILDTFKARTDDSVVVVFMGYGDLQSLVESAAQMHSNIYYYPAVEPSVVLEYTSSADIGISIIENTCLSYYYCMPNKLFEYAMTGLPVIVSDMREMVGVVEGHQFGSVLKDFSVDSLNATIDFSTTRDLGVMSDNAHSFARSNSWEHQEVIMLEGYRRMLKI